MQIIEHVEDAFDLRSLDYLIIRVMMGVFFCFGNLMRIYLVTIFTDPLTI